MLPYSCVVNKWIWDTKRIKKDTWESGTANHVLYRAKLLFLSICFTCYLNAQACNAGAAEQTQICYKLNIRICALISKLIGMCIAQIIVEDPGTNKSVFGKAITVSHRGRTLGRIFKAKYSHLGCFHQSSLAIYWITQVSYLSHESGPPMRPSSPLPTLVI